MATLKASERARLPDRAFAYVDSQGQRRLPIHDAAHVRNALARFAQVKFEDDGARDRARRRLLNAAKKFGIVPVGFIDGQLHAERTGSSDAAKLPTGFVTFLMTDIEGSTSLLNRLGDRYGGLLDDVRGIIRGAVEQSGGRVVDARADECFAVFEVADGAIRAAVEMQRAIQERTWPRGVTVRVRAGIHSGRPNLTATGYIGLAVHTVARVGAVANGGQIVVSGQTKTALGRSPRTGIRFRNLGRHPLPGLTKAVALYQLDAEGLPTDFPPLTIA